MTSETYFFGHIASTGSSVLQAAHLLEFYPASLFLGAWQTYGSNPCLTDSDRNEWFRTFAKCRVPSVFASVLSLALVIGCLHCCRFRMAGGPGRTLGGPGRALGSPGRALGGPKPGPFPPFPP